MAEESSAHLREGDRVFVTGGYDVEPAWLGGGGGFSGTLERFIPGQNELPAAVVRTSEGLSAEGATGNVLVLELRYEGASWVAGATVHVELCDFEPEAAAWASRRQGTWVESHATVRHA